MSVLIFSLGALVLLAVLALLLFVESRAWGRRLVAYRLRFPSSLTADQVAAWLAGLPPSNRGLLGSSPCFGIEIVAGKAGIEHRLWLPQPRAEAQLSQLQTALPGVRYDRDPETTSPASDDLLIRLRLRGHEAPLGSERAEAASAALLAALQPLTSNEAITLRWIVGSASVPPLSPRQTTASALFLDDEGRVQGDRLRARRKKQRAPLVRASLLIRIQATSPARRRQLGYQVGAALSVMDAPGAVVRRSWINQGRGRRAFANWTVPILSWGFTLNTEEAAGLLGLPIGAPEVPGLPLGTARQLLLPAGRFARGVIVARSDHPASRDRAIRLGTRERLQHLHIVGPTGTGKSTLLAQLVLQDIERDRGVVVLDPKRDLVEAIAARVPERRAADVVLLDPTDVARPIGVNVLGSGESEASRELAAEFTLGIFRALFHDSWGPRTDDVVRSGLLTLSSTRPENGAAWTLLELPELLTDEAFRRRVLSRPGVPESVRGFWAWFDSVSEAQQATVIGPSLNKLRAFTTRTPVRLLIGQSSGLDLRSVFTERKIILIPLSSGEVGRPVAELLGSLLLARLWAAVRARTAVAPERRTPAFIYLDEFQDFLRLPLDITDLLATARGLGVGLTLAHQHLDQLPATVRAGVLSTARNRIVFQVGHDDAGVLARHLAPLTADDLMHLDAHAVAIQGVDQGAVQRPLTGQADPLDARPAGALDVRRLSREHYGRPRTDVEAEIRSRTQNPAGETPLGRRHTRRQEDR